MWEGVIIGITTIELVIELAVSIILIKFVK